MTPFQLSSAPGPLHDQWKSVCESYDRMMEGTKIAALQVSGRAAARRRRCQEPAGRNRNAAQAVNPPRGASKRKTGR